MIQSWVIENKLLILLCIGTAYSFYWLIDNQKKLKISHTAAFIISLLHTIVGVVCVKFFAVMESGFDFENAGNMSIYGAVFILPLVYYLGARVSKRDMREVFDIFTICVLATLICARFNCILSGCCLGKCISGSDTLTWPTRELEIVFYVILILFLKNKVYKGKTKGTAYPIYMVSYGTFRFIIEWFREGEAIIFGMLHRAHLWSILSIVIGSVLLYRMISKKVKSNKKQKS